MSVGPGRSLDKIPPSEEEIAEIVAKRALEILPRLFDEQQRERIAEIEKHLAKAKAVLNE